MPTINSVLESIQRHDNKLKRANISNGKQEIIWYLESKNLINKEQLYSNTYTAAATIKRAIKFYYELRVTQMPHQYILNSSNFYGRDFYVDQRVLIPRPETEQMIEILKKFKAPFNSGLEIGIGSGCIALTLCLEKLVNVMIGSDISVECLEVAKINQQNYNITNLSLIRHDILTDSFNQKFDLIVSNPPYVSSDEYNGLPQHIQAFEPKVALTDCNDGLLFYKRFSQLLPSILSKKGTFICELGSAHLITPITNIFKNQDYNVVLYNDLNHDPRFLVISFV